jgi:hypothetical protein
MGALHLIFDRVPSIPGARLIEAEDSTGKSVNAGKWRLCTDGRAEFITALPGLEARATPIYERPPRIEDYVQMFHEDCGGIVIGPRDNLVCAECGLQIDAFTRQAGPTRNRNGL